VLPEFHKVLEIGAERPNSNVLDRDDSSVSRARLHCLIVDTDDDLLDDRRREVDTESREMVAVADNVGFGKLTERAAVLRPLTAIPVET